jgi:hypothetical protein
MAKGLTHPQRERYARTAEFRDNFSERGMTSSDSESSQQTNGTANPPQLPVIWVGYLLGFATIVAELVAVGRHPELAKQSGIPPLYLFLVSFVGGVYWLVCVYRYHVVIAHAPGWKHPISPARAVGFHFIPFFNLYWIFRWPREIANFVNQRLQRPVMRPVPIGVAVLAALILRILDPGFGLVLLFFPMSYISACLRRAFGAPRLEVE